MGESVVLCKEERITLANVLHSYCEINGRKEKVIDAIDHMIESLRAYIANNDISNINKLFLPKVLEREVVMKVEE